MGRGKGPYVSVDPSLHRVVCEVAQKRHMTLEQISQWVLGFSRNYLSNILKKPEPRMQEDMYLKLIIWLGDCEPEDFLRDEKSQAVSQPVEEGMITGVTGIYNKLNELLSEQKKTNIILQELVRAYKEDQLGRKNQLMSTLGTGEAVRKIAEDVHMTKEKVTAIFTEVKYNMTEG